MAFRLIGIKPSCIALMAYWLLDPWEQTHKFQYKHKRFNWTKSNWTSWRHQMEAFSALLTLCAGISPFTTEFPIQRPVARGFDVSLICAWLSSWVNNREAGDLRRHCAHSDVIVINGACQKAGHFVSWQMRNHTVCSFIIQDYIKSRIKNVLGMYIRLMKWYMPSPFMTFI